MSLFCGTITVGLKIVQAELLDILFIAVSLFYFCRFYFVR